MSNIQVRPLAEVKSLGEIFVASGFFSDTKAAAQAIVKILAGQEMGFGPMASMTGVYIVKGKVSLSANLMAAALKRSGRYNYRVHEMTPVLCEIEFFEKGEGIGISSFSMEDAKKAGLTGNATWTKYPRNMLFARAMSNGVRWYCPDIFGGPLYTPEEMGAVVNGETGEILTPTATITRPNRPPARKQKKLQPPSAPPQEERSTGMTDVQLSEALAHKAKEEEAEALGIQLYGASKWPAKRTELLLAVTAGTSEDWQDLTEEHLDMLITGFKQRLAAPAPAPAPTPSPEEA